MMKRLNNISLFRFIATILIFVYHVVFILVPSSSPIFMSFSKLVQGLTALSGFLYGMKVIKKGFFKKSISKIMIPALIALFIMIIWIFVARLFNHQDFISNNISYRAFNGSLLIPCGNFWYIPFILICYALLPLLEKSLENKKYVFIIISICILELMFDYFFSFATTIVAFVIGYYVSHFCSSRFLDKTEKLPVWALILLLIVSVIFYVLYYFSFRFTSSFYFIKQFFLFIREFSGCIFGTSSFFVIIYLFKFINKTTPILFLEKMDKYSYAFYLFNQAFMVGAMNVTNAIPSFIIKVLIIALLTSSFAVLTTYLSNKTTTFLKRVS